MIREIGKLARRDIEVMLDLADFGDKQDDYL
jgi:hypothetical protein